jgi:hypothetical protein
MFIGTLFVSVAVVWPCISSHALAQQDAASQPVELGIIVTSTENEAAGILRQLNAGWDFSVLAKEKSIDPSSKDGGYMGRMSLAQLSPEMRDALAGHTAGQHSGVISVPSGFAIMKIFSVPPATEDLNSKSINALNASGDIRYGPTIAGLSEADYMFRSQPKPEGWVFNLRQSCNLRTQSYDAAMKEFVNFTNTPRSEIPATYNTADIIRIHMLGGQLFAYTGKMEEAIKEFKIAYQMVQEVKSPQSSDHAVSGFGGMGASTLAKTIPSLPKLEEIIGTAYLHWAEMENGVYRNSGDMDLFPPANPKESYEKKEESRLAIQYFTQYLTQDPNDIEVKWLLNYAYSTLGEYPAGVPKAYLIPLSDFQSKEDIGRFVDVAPAAGLNVMREAGGLAVDDFENNGLLDIFASSMETCDPIKYFHNNGDGTFTDRTAQAGLADQLGALNIMQVDYNNDGCMDLFIPRGGWEYLQKRTLLRNNCNGTFTDVTEASGLGDNGASQTQTAVWADIDNDGYLDLFIANENSPSQLFHNKGDGTFEDISHSAGIDQAAFSKGVTAADYDQDGYVDFYVSNYGSPNYLYHNNGNLTFTDVARQAGVQAPIVSFATWFFDYDNDGWPDLFVASYVTSVAESMKPYLGLPQKAEALKLYRNKHDGTFEDVTEKVGLNKAFMAMGAGFGDIRNDGYLSIYIGNGNPSYTAMTPHALLLNKDGKQFVDITASSGTGELHKGHSISFADLDRSGNEAIIAHTGGAVPGDAHTLRVFKNPGNNNDWINVHLVGVKSNRSGVGAQIKVTVTDDGQEPRSIYRTVGENSSFGSNPMEQHIGLGHNAHIVAIDVWWPATNTRQHFTNVANNQFIEIKEFAKEVSKLERHSFHLGAPSTTAAKQ